MTNKFCIITNESDCELTDLTVDGVDYWIKEDLADELPLKKLKEMVRNKILEKEQKKNEAIERISKAAEDLGISKEDLGRLLLGQNNNSNNSNNSQNTTNNRQLTKPKVIDKGFEEVDGELKNGVSARVKVEGDLPPSLPGYSSISDNDGNTIRESNKRIKKLEDGIVQKSDFGTTVIRIDKRSGSELDRLLRSVDENGNLTRASVAGGDYVSGAKTIDCPMCRGSGVNRVNYQKCVKCDGAGTITT